MLCLLFDSVDFICNRREESSFSIDEVVSDGCALKNQHHSIDQTLKFLCFFCLVLTQKWHPQHSAIGGD